MKRVKWNQKKKNGGSNEKLFSRYNQVLVVGDEIVYMIPDITKCPDFMVTVESDML